MDTYISLLIKIKFVQCLSNKISSNNVAFHPINEYGYDQPIGPVARLNIRQASVEDHPLQRTRYLDCEKSEGPLERCSRQ